MSEDFSSFNAPKFVDFSQTPDDDTGEDLESYFEIDHEIEPLQNLPRTEDHDGNETGEYCDAVPSIASSSDLSSHKDYAGFRRSMSEGNLRLNHKKTDSNKNRRTRDDHRPRSTSSNRVNEKQKSRSHAENINRLAQPKYGSTNNLHKEQFVSVAEQVVNFQARTPTRFRSTAKNTVVNGGSHTITSATTTVPQSPALSTKTRTRPVYALTQEQKELQEYEEVKKFKIKANPINKKVLQGPIKPQVAYDKKPPTIPEPFKITAQPIRKPEPPKTNEHQFHANPVPRSVLEPPKPINRPHHHTEPITPEFMKNFSKDKPEKELTHQSPKSMRPSKTIPQPFSFEKRDQALAKKKETFIQKVLEEEKKAREFHANPVPKSVSSAKNNSLVTNGKNYKGSSSSLKSFKSNENMSTVTNFKAKTPTVLYTKPFEPKRDDRSPTELKPFDLNTDRRAEERKKFLDKLKRKEYEIALLKQNEAEKQLQMEREQIAQLRKEAEFKANPVVKYKPVEIVPSNKVTEPISPKFHTNKENLVNN